MGGSGPNAEFHLPGLLMRSSLKLAELFQSDCWQKMGEASDGRRYEIGPHSERSERTSLGKNIGHIQDRSAQGWIALEFRRPCVCMPLKKNFEIGESRSLPCG
jgi:hypothetical protein